MSKKENVFDVHCEALAERLMDQLDQISPDWIEKWVSYPLVIFTVAFNRGDIYINICCDLREQSIDVTRTESDPYDTTSGHRSRAPTVGRNYLVELTRWHRTNSNLAPRMKKSPTTEDRKQYFYAYFDFVIKGLCEVIPLLLVRSE